jgi:hypothetical protein
MLEIAAKFSAGRLRITSVYLRRISIYVPGGIETVIAGLSPNGTT